jgi:hypothetical protein
MRAREFIVDHKEEQLDEFLPLITAAGGALARGAAAAGSAIGRGAAAVGRGVVQGAKALGSGAAAVGSGIARGAEVVGNVVSAAKAAKDTAQDDTQDDNQLKAGGRVSIPKLGAVDIIAVTSTGVTLNTQSQLGFNITVDPRSLQK